MLGQIVRVSIYKSHTWRLGFLTTRSFFLWDCRMKKRWQNTTAVAIANWGLQEGHGCKARKPASGIATGAPEMQIRHQHTFCPTLTHEVRLLQRHVRTQCCIPGNRVQPSAYYGIVDSIL